MVKLRVTPERISRPAHPSTRSGPRPAALALMRVAAERQRHESLAADPSASLLRPATTQRTGLVLLVGAIALFFLALTSTSLMRALVRMNQEIRT